MPFPILDTTDKTISEIYKVLDSNMIGKLPNIDLVRNKDKRGVVLDVMNSRIHVYNLVLPDGENTMFSTTEKHAPFELNKVLRGSSEDSIRDMLKKIRYISDNEVITVDVKREYKV
jgi:bisphosphoglycerate-dependent phosphoglycerate mutase